jgi:cytochrome c-type biogenesis protein CcmE
VRICAHPGFIARKLIYCHIDDAQVSPQLVGMTRKQKRTATIVGLLAVASVATGLILSALKDTIVFFYTPAEIASKQVAPGTRVRLGGLVEKGSVVRGADAKISFMVTDTEKTMQVNFTGQLPDLFREGQGVVAEGVVGADGNFTADSVLAKHDENYMPKEVADKLKEKGVWKEGAQ